MRLFVLSRGEDKFFLLFEAVCLRVAVFPILTRYSVFGFLYISYSPTTALFYDVTQIRIIFYVRRNVGSITELFSGWELAKREMKFVLTHKVVLVWGSMLDCAKNILQLSIWIKSWYSCEKVCLCCSVVWYQLWKLSVLGEDSSWSSQMLVLIDYNLRNGSGTR